MKGKKTTTGYFLDNPNEEMRTISTKWHNDLT